MTIEVLEVAFEWVLAGESVAIVTVVKTWGSSPCPAGSRMAVTRSGRFTGAVSGGCIEAAVVEAALRTIEDGDLNVLEFGVTDEMAWQVGLACGGSVKLFLERLS